MKILAEMLVIHYECEANSGITYICHTLEIHVDQFLQDCGSFHLGSNSILTMNSAIASKIFSLAYVNTVVKYR